MSTQMKARKKKSQEAPQTKTQKTLREKREEAERVLQDWLVQLDKQFGPDRATSILSLVVRYTRSLKKVH